MQSQEVGALIDQRFDCWLHMKEERQGSLLFFDFQMKSHLSMAKDKCVDSEFANIRSPLKVKDA